MPFEMGQVVAVGRVAQALQRDSKFSEQVAQCVRRYMAGDFGEIPLEDVQANADAIKDGERIIARYTGLSQEDIYIITEWDRSYTSILFCEDY